MDGNPFKVYCIDLFQTVNLPDNSYSETCEYAVSKVQYVLNNYYPLNSSYPGKLSDNNQEVAAIQLVLWSLYNNINIQTVTDSVIKNRALTIRADADINGMITESIISFTINPAADPNAFYIKTIDENGDPIAVSDIVLSISIAGTLSEDTTSTDASGISPDIYVTGALNGSVITATARMRYAQGRIIDGFISDRQTLAIALPVWGRMGVETEWGAEPVELSSFTSIITGNKVDLNWTTSSEINNSHFEIERLELENENIVWKKLVLSPRKTNSGVFIFQEFFVPLWQFQNHLQRYSFQNTQEKNVHLPWIPLKGLLLIALLFFGASSEDFLLDLLVQA